MNIEEFLTLAAKEEASDLFIVAGLPLTMKVNGVMRRINEEKMMPQDTEKIIREIYEKALDRDINQLLKTGDDDFSFAIPGLSRFRVSAYKQRGSLAAVIRVIAFRLPDYKQLRIPEQVMKLSELNKGLVLVTGPAGSGKSTTLACMIEEINETKEDHIITLEDPLEFLHQHKKSIVSQREVNMDTVNYVTSLRAALRQSPDVILLGEMRDYETIQVVMTAAETGHLVFSTLHTNDAVSSIIRLIDMGVEPYMVASSLVGLVAQRLVRVVCPECGYWDEPTEQEKAFIGPKITRVRRAQGCNSCSHTGYVGRRAIHEILCVDNQMRRMITQRTPMEELRSYATHYLGMESLTDEALKLVADGTTTVEELKKVAYYI